MGPDRWNYRHRLRSWALLQELDTLASCHDLRALNETLRDHYRISSALNSREAYKVGTDPAVSGPAGYPDVGNGRVRSLSDHSDRSIREYCEQIRNVTPGGAL
jgi:hypothetical protein